MNNTNNPKLSPNARSLRREMTKEERHLWYDFLKTLPVTVHRQKVLGSYIVDFYIHSAKLVIEIDGMQHHSIDHQQADVKRDAYLSSYGITVLRYDNKTVIDEFAWVCEDILNHMGLGFSALRKQ